MGLPLKMDEDSPEPNVRLLRGTVEEYDGREVSDTTLVFDQRTKVRLYAVHGIPEYWIVNLRERTLEVRRRPSGEGYDKNIVFREGASVLVGGGEIAVSSLLPKPETT